MQPTPSVGTREPARRHPRLTNVHKRVSSVICRVLAPPEAPGRRPRAVTESPPAPPAPAPSDFWSSTTSFASQLLSHFRVPAFAVASPDAVLREASSKERELQRAKAPLDVSAFLGPVGVWELKHIRKLSSLTALTYFMNLVTPLRLHRMHNLELVTTSRACEIRPYEHCRTAEEVGADGDGMAVSFDEARRLYAALKSPEDSGAASALNAATLGREAAHKGLASDAAAASQQQAGMGGPSWPLPPPAATAPPGAQHSEGAGGRSGPAATVGVGPSAAAQTSAPATPPGLPRMLRTPAEMVATASAAAESLLASLPIGGVLVGANNRAGNTLPPGASPAPLGTSPPSSPAGAGGVDGLGRSKATAASITALATAELHKHALRGALRGRSSGGSGFAAVNASGMLPPALAGAAGAAAVAAAGGGAGAAAVAGATLAAGTFACPSEWFVVDDPATNTRAFVIQGSDTIDHWRLNLTFDPVVFEEPSLGVKVHRGVYEAASVLYDRFLPLVYEHLESSPFSKVTFTGHSIGGSLATLLLLMYRSRGVLQPHSIAPVYTFGAPAVFCQTHADSRSHSRDDAQARSGSPSASASAWGSSLWSFPSVGSATSMSSVEDGPVVHPPVPGCDSAGAAAAAAAHASGCTCGADTLLSRLGLPPAAVRNVIMARDVVPRAFACDYRPVADILKGWGPSFKEHVCLNRHGRKHLYYFVGRLYILQPDNWHTFVGSDPDHPMLPPGPELYLLSDDHPPHTAALAAAADAAATAEAPQARRAPARAAASSIVEAVWELMDCPHPLETLADPGAYLASGIISRYHNPEHYTKALGRVTHLKRRAERRGWEVPLPSSSASASAAGGVSAALQRVARIGGWRSGRRGAGVKAGGKAADGEGDAGRQEGAEAAWDSSDSGELAPAVLAGEPHICR